jgi:hypothetical protein
VERAGEVDGEDALPALDRDVREALERVEPALVTMISTGPSSARTFSSAAFDRRAVG